MVNNGKQGSSVNLNQWFAWLISKHLACKQETNLANEERLTKLDLISYNF